MRPYEIPAVAGDRAGATELGGPADVLELLAAGHPNPTIAGRLGLSEKTVRNNVSAIFVKLPVPDRSAPIIRARDAGISTA